MQKFLTVKDVMGILPLGKTKVVEIINSLPHINTGGKLLVESHDLDRWIMANTVTGNKKAPAPAKAVRKQYLDMGLTEDGLIPYRKTRRA